MDALTPSTTDPLTDLLNGVRTSGAVFNQSLLSGSWALRFENGSPMALAVPVRGSAWVVREGSDPVRLGPGDVAVLCGGAPYVIADDPASRPNASGVDTRHPRSPSSTLLVSGLYSAHLGTPGRLLAALPPLAVVEAGLGFCPVTLESFDEIARVEPGQQIMLDRMLDLLLITSLRAWFTRPGAEVPAWYRAHGDPVVGTALRLLHANPTHPWTVESLAAKTGVSRAALARRFTTLVGRPPMTYFREWRLALAADLLRESGATVAAVAHRTGFSTAFALSAAFKRERGVSPSAHRQSASPAGSHTGQSRSTPVDSGPSS